MLFALIPIHMLAQSDARTFDDAIEDNSFFVEEAYNQEDRVVQHISTLLSSGDPRNYAFGFTQEWPVGSQLHQLSVTVPYQWMDGVGVNGLSDVLLNYRYQLSGSDGWAAIAPRLSLILPVGDELKGLGAGVWGVQFNLPVSKRVSNGLVVHANVGSTLLPGVKAITLTGAEVKKTLSSFNVGVSAIALVSANVNLMLEIVRNSTGGIDAEGNVVHTHETIVNPGIRAAIDIGSLQIVPGLAAPVITAGGETRVGSFVYLSFEHPF
ncbi:MAG: transporter [Ignavibacteriae bacterium]|nr:transporter [Ignavibacteriota bacterium]